MKALLRSIAAVSVLVAMSAHAEIIETGPTNYSGDLWYIQVVADKGPGGNDCAGYFGGTKGTDCIAYGSPLVAKWDNDSNSWEFEDAGLTANDFVFDFSLGDSSGLWGYKPDSNDDPDIRYWAAKGGNGFNIFWYAGESSDPFDAVAVQRDGTLNTWFTPGSASGISHLSFYDTGVPVPEPGALALLGIGGVGLGWFLRRRKSPATATL